jgi:hypothetical protein
VYHRKLHNILPRKGLDHLTTWLLGDSLDSPNKTPIRQPYLHDSDPSHVANKQLLHVVKRFSSPRLSRVDLACQCRGGTGVVVCIIMSTASSDMFQLFLFEWMVTYWRWPSFRMSRWVFALMVELVNTSETSADVYETTWHNIPEDSHLNTRRLGNLKSHLLVASCLPREFRSRRHCLARSSGL